jgi:hypothetical protein
VRPAAGSLGWSAACRRPAQAVRQAARSRLDLPTWSPPWTAGPQTNTPTPLQQIGEHRAPPLKIHSMSIVSSWLQSTITSSLSSIEQLPQCQSELNRKLEKSCNLLYVFCNFALYHEPFYNWMVCTFISSMIDIDILWTMYCNFFHASIFSIGWEYPTFKSWLRHWVNWPAYVPIYTYPFACLNRNHISSTCCSLTCPMLLLAY